MNELPFNIVPGSTPDKAGIIKLLELRGDNMSSLLKMAAEVKNNTVGNSIYFRGLIEFSNICDKNCLYCGLRKNNRKVTRYNIADRDIIESVMFALENNFASVVLQSGEIATDHYVKRVDRLLKEIDMLTNGKIRVTLSCGEQTMDTYKRWYESGAQRYLLRIESSVPSLYRKIHPDDEMHSHARRLECLYNLKELGYQTGTGVMIGLPFQTLDDLAADLLFMRTFDIDMVGMGPYLEHVDTPLYNFRETLATQQERFLLSLRMVAVLRIMMPDINIAATTAMQTIDPFGREKAVQAGANVIMPNITPGMFKKHYLPYDNKPFICETSSECLESTAKRFSVVNGKLAYGEWGDSRHYVNRKL